MFLGFSYKYVLLSTGLRREELVNLDLDQVEPNTPEALRTARQGKIARVKGKGKTERTVFLSTQLAKVTGADAYELERRSGHRSQHYIRRYTDPPEQVAASYIEEF